MALCPFAKHLLIPPGANDPRIKARAAILHVRDGFGPSLHDFFDGPSGGIESHFYIRLDGTIEQYRDTAFQADANLDANDFAVSIETEGIAAGRWSAQQLASIKRLLLWLHAVDGIPLRKIQRWDGSGIGYHVQFGSPSHWTPVAKSCPGPERIKQFDEVVIPSVLVPAKPAPTPNVTRALRAKTQDARIDALHDVVKHGAAGAQAAAAEYLRAIDAVNAAQTRLRAVRDQLKKFEEK